MGDSSSDPTGAHFSKPNLAIILGSTLGGVVALVLFGILAFFLFRRHRQTNRRFSIPPPLTPALPIQQADMEAGFSRPPSDYFREVKLSPSGPKYPSGPPQIINTTFSSDGPLRLSVGSYQSFKSTEAMLLPIPSNNERMVQVPKASATRSTSSADQDSGIVRIMYLSFGNNR